MKRTRVMITGAGALALMLAALACGTLNQPSVDQPVEPSDDLPRSSLLDVPGLTEVTLTSPIEGAGIKPLFQWNPVQGASAYVLIVYDEQGRPYWAWEGEETSVYLGGAHRRPPDDSPGPVLATGMSWAVSALDANRVPIASSEVRLISP